MLEVLLVGSAAKLGLVVTLGIRFPAPEGSGLLSFDPCGMKKRQLALPHSKAQPRAAVPHAQAGHARDRIGASMLPVI